MIQIIAFSLIAIPLAIYLHQLQYHSLFTCTNCNTTRYLLTQIAIPLAIYLHKLQYHSLFTYTNCNTTRYLLAPIAIPLAIYLHKLQYHSLFTYTNCNTTRYLLTLISYEVRLFWLLKPLSDPLGTETRTRIRASAFEGRSHPVPL